MHARMDQRTNRRPGSRSRLRRILQITVRCRQRSESNCITLRRTISIYRIYPQPFKAEMRNVQVAAVSHLHLRQPQYWTPFQRKAKAASKKAIESTPADWPRVAYPWAYLPLHRFPPIAKLVVSCQCHHRTCLFSPWNSALPFACTTLCSLYSIITWFALDSRWIVIDPAVSIIDHYP